MSSSQTILGRKVGMTQIFDDNGVRVGVTVIEAGPCTVLQVKDEDSDGYFALQLGFADQKEKHATKPEFGHAAKAGSGPKKLIREVRLNAAAEDKVGDVVNVSIFDDVKKVDVIAQSKGKGYAGTIKRWNFSRQRASHGNSKNHRTAGGLGRQMSVNKGVPKGKKQAGRLGNDRTTVQGLRVIRVDAEKNLLVVRGAVPGFNGQYVVVRASLQEKVRRDKEKKGKI